MILNYYKASLIKKIILGLIVVNLILLFNVFLNGNYVGAETREMDVDSSNYSGLHRTGVAEDDKGDGSNNGAVLPGNVGDSHWQLIRIDNASDSATCQDLNHPEYRSNIFNDGAGRPATTVYEANDNVYSGRGASGAGLGAYYPDWTQWTGWVWNLQSSQTNARWISQNAQGLHVSSASCSDPSGIGGDSGVRHSNVWTFKLVGGFNIKANAGETIDASKLGLKMYVQTDNLISVKVNGTVMNSPDREDHFYTSPCDEFSSFLQSGSGSKYICPDFSSGSTSELQLKNGLRVGDNDLTIEILSTYSNIGFMINQFELTGKKSVKFTPGEGQVTDCLPTEYDVSVGTDVRGFSLPVYVTSDTGYSRTFSGAGSYPNNQILGWSYYLTSPLGNPTMELTFGVTWRNWSWEIVDWSCSPADPETGAGGGCSPIYGWVLKGEGINYHTEPKTCYNYKFGGTIDTNYTSKILEASTKLNITGKIFTTPANIGFPKTWSKPTNWKLLQLTYEPTTKLPSDRVNEAVFDKSNELRSYFRSKTAEVTKNKDGVEIKGDNVDKIYNDINISHPVIIGDLPAGTQVCYTILIEPESSSAVEKYYHSNVVCHVVYKKPKVQIWGGDLVVGRSTDSNISTSVTQKYTNVNNGVYTDDKFKSFGSWVEYGIFASGRANGMASGAAFSGGISGTNANARCATLSFANQGELNCITSNNIGNYTNSSSMPDVSSEFPASGATDIGSNVDLGSVIANKTYTHSGALTINGSNIGEGRWVVINAPNADVTIAGDITYASGPFSRIDTMPQAVIIAKSINIKGNVKNIDAWLVTKGQLNTCSDYGGNLYYSNGTACSNKLTVNGPVMAGSLLLRRTFGAGAETESDRIGATPAEVFNLRADAYLWSYAMAKSHGNIRTVYSVDMPPRF